MTSIEYAYARFCDERLSLPSEDQVRAVEAKLNISFPPDFRQYLLEYNGAYFRPEPVFTGPDADCPRAGLDFISGIGARHPCAELGGPHGLHPRIFDDNDPPQVLPIGYTPIGQLLYLIVDPEGEDYGSIGMKLPFSDKYYHLADGIEEFFAMLTENNPDE